MLGEGSGVVETFEPRQPTTRRHVVVESLAGSYSRSKGNPSQWHFRRLILTTFILGALVVSGPPDAVASHQFTDVPDGAFYHGAVDFLAIHGRHGRLWRWPVLSGARGNTW